jgi:hypothetical protein
MENLNHSPDPPDPPDPDFEVGILFVHGIGDQARGQTLLDFGEPLLQCLEEWIRGRSLGEMEVRRAELSPRPELTESAQATIHIKRTTASGTVQSDWFLSEAWWASEFHRPDFRRLAAWLLQVGPWIIVSHAARPYFYGQRMDLIGHSLTTIAVILSVPLAWIMQLAVITISLFAWIPVPVFRKALSGLLLRMTGTLGDSFVLTECPLQRQAILDKVERAIDEVSNRCGKVVIIAHSQGAAIVHDVLKNRGCPNNVKTFISFGAAIYKLRELKKVSEERLFRVPQVVLALSLILSMATLVAAVSYRQHVPVFGFLTVFIALGAVVWVKDYNQRIASRKQDLPLSDVEWLDLYASLDPVPNGSLLLPGESEARFDSNPVKNCANPFTDHVSYWENRDGFVLRILTKIDELTELKLLSELGNLRQIENWRSQRVTLLNCLRFIGLVGVIGWAFVLRDDLGAYGEELVLATLESASWTKPVVAMGSTVATAIAQSLAVSRSDVAELSVWVLGAILPTTMILLFHRFVVSPAWQLWDEREFRLFCRPSSRPEHWADRAAPLLGVFLVGLIPLVLPLHSAIRGPELLLADLMLGPVLCLALVMLVGIVMMVVAGWRWAFAFAGQVAGKIRGRLR